MKWFVSCCAALALLAAVPAQAKDFEFRPVDTNKLVVQPSKLAANLAAGTINLAGRSAASSIENNGYIKTINNLFSFKRVEPKFQTGPSLLPSPNMFKSSQYPNFNSPVMPRMQRLER